jgi:hypothetical protein
MPALRWNDDGIPVSLKAVKSLAFRWFRLPKFRAMLYVSLTLPLVLLGISYLAIWRSKRWILVYIGCTVFAMAVAGSAENVFVVLVLELQLVTMLVAIPLARAMRPGRTWLPICLPIVATAASYPYYGWIAIQDSVEFNRLQEEYAFESMEDRVPVPAPKLRPAALKSNTSALVQDLENRITTGIGAARNYRLKLLHERTVLSFVRNPGFGVQRMIVPTESTLKWGVRELDAPVPQPAPRISPPESVQPGEPTLTIAVPDSLQVVHQMGVVDFSYSSGQGYARDRRHVAGFLPHGFSKVPAPSDEWTIQTIDLVSLLCHSEPVAYVSDNLPRMDELKEAPTRALDAFETGGLKQLMDGEYLVVGEAGEKLRMLGSIRAVEQCVKCHGAERGDLLGAFSYTLRRKEQ